MATRSTTIRDMIAWEGCAIDLSDCTRIEILVPMNEYENAGPRFETWPDVIRRRVEECVQAWLKQNTARAIRLVSSGVVDRTCVLIIHHFDKTGATSRSGVRPAAETASDVARDRPSDVSPQPPVDPQRCGKCGE